MNLEYKKINKRYPVNKEVVRFKGEYEDGSLFTVDGYRIKKEGKFYTKDNDEITTGNITEFAYLPTDNVDETIEEVAETIEPDTQSDSTEIIGDLAFTPSTMEWCNPTKEECDNLKKEDFKLTSEVKRKLIEDNDVYSCLSTLESFKLGWWIIFNKKKAKEFFYSLKIGKPVYIAFSNANSI